VWLQTPLWIRLGTYNIELINGLQHVLRQREDNRLHVPAAGVMYQMMGRLRVNTDLLEHVSETTLLPISLRLFSVMSLQRSEL
jgi:hypothetical protein